MNSKFKAFLEGIIGSNGKNIVDKLCSNDEALTSVLLPRTLLSYTTMISGLDKYEGEIPGIPNSKINTLAKTITIKGEVYDLVDTLNTAALLAVQLELDTETVADQIDRNKLAVLGKTLDILTKTHFLSSRVNISQPVQTTQQKSQKIIHKKIFQKTLNLSLTEMAKSCSVCGQHEFKDNSFVGCTCFSDLAKSCKTVKTANGCRINFSKHWDEEALLSLFKVLKR